MTTPIIGIPTTRVSDLFVRQRLLDQMQSDQVELFRVQNQLSTGHRFEAPSEDPAAALRVISLQRLMRRKDQVKSNLGTNQSYLNSTDSALGNIANLLSEARATTIGVLGTTATDAQRQAAAEQIDQMLQQLLDSGNQQFRGRYLFAGSKTTRQPFESQAGGVVKYSGNEQRLSSYGDIDQLFDTNLTGSEVFGAISDPVRGAQNLDPVLTYDTRLADLRGGQGISRGSIEVSDGEHTSIIDLNQAETIGDVAAAIKAHPPAARSLDVEITAAKLVIRLDDGAPGNLSIREVGGGTIAAELGIFRDNGVGLDPIEGRDLNPVLRLSTRLQDILGAHATAVVHSPGADNDFLVTADIPGEKTSGGTELNGVQISLVNDPAVTAGHEIVSYDPAGKRIVVAISAGHTQARQVVQAINDQHDADLFPFTARLDPLDEQTGGNGLVATVTATTRDGAGEKFDQLSGLRIVNGGRTFNIDLGSAKTVEDLLNLLNGSEAGVLAEINEDRTGIDIRSRLSGCDFAIGENGGTTAAQLGVRTFTRDTLLTDLNFGRGVNDWAGGPDAGADFFITRADGAELAIDIAGKQTVGDVLDLINNHPGNVGGTLVARLAAYGNGIELVDNTLAGGTLSVSRAPLSTAAVDLGLIPQGADTSSAASTGGTPAAAVPSAAAKSGLIFSAKQAGPEYNGVRVIFDSTLPPAAPSYNSADKTLTFGIQGGTVTAAQIQSALAGSPLGSVFSAEFDPADNSHNDGSGPLAPTTGNVMTHGAGDFSMVKVAFAGKDNDLIFRALAPFPAEDGTNVVFVGGGTGPPLITRAGNALTITYQDGATAQQIVDAFAGNPDFAVTLDPADASDNDGSGRVDANAPGGAALSGGWQSLTGAEVHPLETESIFTALLRIRDGLRSNNGYQVQRSVGLLDRKVTDMNFSRAELGVRQQGIDALSNRLDAENTELQKALSQDYDASLEEVISEFSARQIAFEAALRTAAQLFQMSLLNYL
jgi:flagellin-like hook-associated protein FlgL